MTTAVVFPGQGNQQPGMGRPFYRAWPAVRKRLETLSTAISEDLRRLCFKSSTKELRATRNTQPAVFGISVAIYEELVDRYRLTPDYVAGHSLGHFTALAAAGALDPVEGISLVRKRGELFAAAARENGPGTMLAVLFVDPETVTTVCADREDVSVGLYNAPQQTVISGTREGVTAVKEHIAERTHARFRELDVAAAFHSPIMASAINPVSQAVAESDIKSAEIPVVSDVSCRIYTDPVIAQRDLSKQVTAPVNWRGVIRRLQAADVERYAVLPPAGPLPTLIERIHPGAEIVELETPDDTTTLDSDKESTAEVSKDD